MASTSGGREPVNVCRRGQMMCCSKQTTQGEGGGGKGSAGYTTPAMCGLPGCPRQCRIVGLSG